MKPRTFGTQALWPALALLTGLLTWTLLISCAPVSRTWILLAPIVAVPFVVGPFRSDDGWWPGLSALLTAIWWLVMGAGHPLWQPSLIALCLAAHWLASAWGAQAPRWAGHATGYLGKRFLTYAAFLAACVAALGLVWLAVAVAPLPFTLLWALLGAIVLLVSLIAAGILISR